jgi:hypothetical protein
VRVNWSFSRQVRRGTCLFSDAVVLLVEGVWVPDD